MKRVKFAVISMVSILLAGCSSSISGSATPSPDVNASAPSNVGGTGVPKVANPINTARYEQDPCAALTGEQLQKLNITTQPKADLSNKLGPDCTWNAFDQIGLTVGATLLTAGSSLVNLYKLHEQGSFPYFQPVADVSGYPGVLLDDLDAKPKNMCGMSVAVRDDLIYSVQVTIDPDKEEAKDPCPVAQKIAEMAVSTMKAGA